MNNTPLRAFARYASLSTLGMIATSCYILADTFNTRSSVAQTAWRRSTSRSGLQRYPRHRAAARHGRRDQVRHPQKPGCAPPRQHRLHPHARDSGGRGGCLYGGWAVRRAGAGRAARRKGRDCRHDRDLFAGAAAVLAGLPAQRSLCLLCPQRRRALALDGGDGRRQPGERRHGLYLHLPLRAWHLRRGARHRVFAGHRHLHPGPALGCAPLRIPPAGQPPQPPAGRPAARSRRAGAA